MRQARILIASAATFILAAGAAAAQTYSTTASSIPSTTFASTLNSFVSSGYSTSGDIGADGIDLDGVDNVELSHVVLGNLQNDGIAAWDGLDCNGYSPVYATIQSISTSGGSTTLGLSSVSGIQVGEYAYLSTIPNTGT